MNGYIECESCLWRENTLCCAGCVDADQYEYDPEAEPAPIDVLIRHLKFEPAYA